MKKWCIYRISGKFCKRMLELFPIKMKALPGLDTANICRNFNGPIVGHSYNSLVQ